MWPHCNQTCTCCQVFNLTGHLVYWGHAIIIYPLCESNVYVVSPDAPTHINSPLVEKFSEHFPGESLLEVTQFVGTLGCEEFINEYSGLGS